MWTYQLLICRVIVPKYLEQKCHKCRGLFGFTVYIQLRIESCEWSINFPQATQNIISCYRFTGAASSKFSLVMAERKLILFYPINPLNNNYIKNPCSPLTFIPPPPSSKPWCNSTIFSLIYLNLTTGGRTRQGEGCRLNKWPLNLVSERTFYMKTAT